METKVAMVDNDAVTIELILNASVEQVWNAWTDPALIVNWFGSDPNGKVLKADLNVRTGGSFEVTFIDSDGTRHTCRGIYSIVQECRKLSFSWMWESEPGVESFVTVALTSIEERTQMLFQHANLGIASSHDYLNGWQATFGKLERMLDSKKTL